MPPRKRTREKPQKHELEAFAEKYDTYADIFGDPVALVFKIMSDSVDEEVKLRAADMLMSYRYPRVKAAEGAGSNAPVMNFNVVMPNAQLTPREYGVQSGYSAARAELAAATDE